MYWGGGERESMRRKKKVWEEIDSSALRVQYKEVWEYP